MKTDGKNFLDSLGMVGTLLKKIGDAWQKQEKSRQRLIIVLGTAAVVGRSADDQLIRHAMRCSTPT